MAALSAAQVKEFEATGVLCGIRAVPPSVAAANRAAFDDRAAAEGGAQPHYLSLHSEERWAWDLVTSPTIVNAAAQLLGTDNVFCLATHAFCKLPNTTGFVGWHQVRQLLHTVCYDSLVPVGYDSSKRFGTAFHRT